LAKILSVVGDECVVIDKAVSSYENIGIVAADRCAVFFQFGLNLGSFDKNSFAHIDFFVGIPV
jgi:hypothetical protein